ncbi:MAG: RNA 2',3'-cyclic phosphodiesterase [bacterium]|nr:RNA 2',3'-cyclic phosphodiesterase [bacterium]
MRAFIALDLPYEIKNFVTVQLFSLKKMFNYDDIKWVDTQNYHLTFRFFESVDAKEICQKFGKLKEKLKTIEVKKVIILRELGFFFNRGKIRIIFLNVEPRDFFLQIYDLVEELFGPDKFSPHITVGRIKRNLTVQKEEILKSFRMEEIIFEPQEMVLFKSELTPMGPLYNKIDSFYLR